MISVAERIAKELKVSPRQVEAAVALLDGGATVPFISRYRKEATGGLDDGHLRTLEERLVYLRELDARRDAVLESIASQGKLTTELEAALREADTKTRIEDLYLPFKPKRRTKGEIAREAGLEPLADALLADPSLDPRTEAPRFVDSSKNVPDFETALDGARSILMERFAQDAELVGRVREYCWEHGRFTSRVNEGQEEAGAKYRDYFDHNEPLRDVPSHRALAMLRGFLEGHLYVCLAVDAAQAGAPHPCETMIAAANGIASKGRPADSWLLEVAGAAWRVKLFPHVQTDLLGRVRERAEAEAIRVFAANLKDLLLAAPAGAKAAVGLDPGLRTGVKAAVVDTTGKLVAHATLFPHPPRNDFEGSAAVLAKLVREHDVELIAIGNGTAGRETDRFVAATLKAYPDLKFAKVIVSEAGASVYSASALAAEEFPDLDVTIRGAVSIARRLQDPLAELVKIEPKSIGVGQYQHDVNQSFLARALDATVEDCVNAVGVDLNTASAALLARVSGLGPSAAENIVALRNLRGPYKSRSELMDVPRFGPKTFEQAAGFLRINGGADPLDGSAVHPESYELVERIAAANGRDVRSLIGDSAFLRRLRPADYVTERFGLPTVTDILKELEKPGRDPRPEFRTASLRDEVETLADLEPGMILEGTVTNVANFGAFVDIGVHQDGLAHISALSRKFVRDPREVVKAGDIVRVKVLSVDMERKRIALTLRLDDESERADGGEIRPETRRGGRPGTGTAAPRETGGGGSLAQAFAQASRKKSR